METRIVFPTNGKYFLATQKLGLYKS